MFRSYYQRFIKEIASNTIPNLISPFIRTNICVTDLYFGLPAGTARVSEAFWQLIASYPELRSTRIMTNRLMPHVIGKPDCTIWFANARDIPKAIRRAEWVYKHSRRNIGYWAWELDHMPAEEANNSQFLSEIWTFSDFTAASIRRSCNVPCYCIPPPVLIDKNLQFERKDYRNLNKYLVVLDATSSIARKNPWTAIKAFKEIFTGQNDKSLTIRITRGDNLPIEIKDSLIAQANPQVTISFDTFIDIRDVHTFMRRHDVYLSLHRAEGLGLNILEAILFGLPVIATNYGGNVDFCSPEGVDLVNYKLIPVDDPQGNYKEDFFWAEPDYNDVCIALETLACQTPKDIENRIQIARQTAKRYFDTQRILEILLSRLVEK